MYRLSQGRQDQFDRSGFVARIDERHAPGRVCAQAEFLKSYDVQRWRGVFGLPFFIAGKKSLSTRNNSRRAAVGKLCALMVINNIPRWILMLAVKASLLVLLVCGSACAQDNTANPAPSAGRLQAGESTSPESAFAEPRRLLQQGKSDEAIAQLQQLATQRPGLKGLSHELGVAYYKKGDYLKAVDAFKKAVAEDANDSEGVQLLGLSYYLAGRPAEAIPYLEKVQTWFPRANVDASYILGLSYIQSKDYVQARKAFAR